MSWRSPARKSKSLWPIPTHVGSAFFVAEPAESFALLVAKNADAGYSEDETSRLSFVASTDRVSTLGNPIPKTIVNSRIAYETRTPSGR
jgi:hypothetical protein